MRFRKMSLKWHPDKNIKRAEAAAEIFKAVHAAYHFLTTNNFDYKRWAESFQIPPMQTLEDVLLMALKGADPYQVHAPLTPFRTFAPPRTRTPHPHISHPYSHGSVPPLTLTWQLEILMRKRGDYRPHAEFGINLSIPWNAGSKEAPTYDVRTGSVYTTTQGLEDKTRQELGYSGGGGSAPVINDGAIITTTAGMDQNDLLEKFGQKAAVGADEVRGRRRPVS